MIEINIKTVQQVTVVELAGELDATTAPMAQQQILSLAQSECKIILDMAKVSYMSSTGLRMLLSIYRQICGNKGHVVLVGLAEEIKDTMSMTGFLDFFATCDSLESGLQAVNQ